MKLISVQSKGNRVVRVVQDHGFEVFCKVLSMWPDVGFSYNLVRSFRHKSKSRALKCAKEWLEGNK